MKKSTVLLILLLAGCVSRGPVPEQASAAQPFPGTTSGRTKSDELPQGINVEKPETFDWENYVAEGGSTFVEMERAYCGVRVLKNRMDQLVAHYRKRLNLRDEFMIKHLAIHGDEDKWAGPPELHQLEKFDAIQEQWQKLASLETQFVAEGWRGGSGQRAAIPKAKLRLMQERVKRLVELKSDAMDLNE